MIRNINRSINPFHEIRSAFAKGQVVPGLGPSSGSQAYTFVALEKNVANSFKHAADEKRSAAAGLMLFAIPQGGDITDICEKMGEIELKWADVLNSFSDIYLQYRNTLKSIRDRESHLLKFRERRDKAQDNITVLKRNTPNSGKISEEERKLADVESELLGLEVDLQNFKRVALKEAFYLMFNGIHEMGQKSSIVASYGKYVVDMLDVTPVKAGEERRKYAGSGQTSEIVKDCQLALEHWQPDSTQIRRTITQSRGGHNPFVSSRPDDDDDLAPRVEGIRLADDSEYSGGRGLSPSLGSTLSPPNPESDGQYSNYSRNKPFPDHERASSSGGRSAPSPPPGVGGVRSSSPNLYPPQQQQHQPDSYQSSPQLYPPMPAVDYNQYFQFYEQNNPAVPYQQFQEQAIPDPAFYSQHPQQPQPSASAFYPAQQPQVQIPQPQIPQPSYAQQPSYQPQHPQQPQAAFPSAFPGGSPAPAKKTEGWKMSGGRK